MTDCMHKHNYWRYKLWKLRTFEALTKNYLNYILPIMYLYGFFESYTLQPFAIDCKECVFTLILDEKSLYIPKVLYCEKNYQFGFYKTKRYRYKSTYMPHHNITCWIWYIKMAGMHLAGTT